MEKQLSELERILNIPDRAVRRVELCKLAHSVGMLPRSDRYIEGLSDQRIVLAIYDGFVRQQKQAEKNRKLIYTACFWLVIVTIGLAVIPKSAIRYFHFFRAKYDKRQKAFTGLDKDGKVIRDERGQPVLFRQLDGVYDEYYDDGKVHFTYHYADGKVKELTEYDKDGQLMTHILYDEKGNPILEDQ